MRQRRVTGKIPKIGERNPNTGLPAVRAKAARLSLLARAHRLLVPKDALSKAAKTAQRSRTVHAVTKTRK